MKAMSMPPNFSDHANRAAVAHGKSPAAPVTITVLTEIEDEQWAAGVMAASDPWVTLGIGLDTSLKIMANTTRERYLARVQGIPAGFLVINMSGGFTGYIQLLGVATGHRGQGVGRTLLEFAEQRIFRETPNVFICVSDFNRDARGFYAKLGYEEVGELKDYVVRGHNEILLRKTIGPLRNSN
jgi:ribosomal protein S18 acetylase RimI-like enzyme